MGEEEGQRATGESDNFHRMLCLYPETSRICLPHNAQRPVPLQAEDESASQHEEAGGYTQRQMEGTRDDAPFL